MPDRNLANSSVLITGASQGIGRALATHFGSRCRHVIITARTETGLHHTLDQVRSLGGSCDFISADLRDPGAIELLGIELEKRGVLLDVVIHNAADVTSKPLVSTSLAEIDSIVSTNVTGPLQLTRAVLNLFRPDGFKTVVWISSLSGYKPNPNQTVYSISKSAVNAASIALRAELGPQGFTLINVPLSSVDIAGLGGTGRVPVEKVCAEIERAIIKRRPEIFLSPLSKLLMRVYGLLPRLMRF